MTEVPRLSILSMYASAVARKFAGFSGHWLMPMPVLYGRMLESTGR